MTKCRNCGAAVNYHDDVKYCGLCDPSTIRGKRGKKGRWTD